jgi:phosphoribosylaminoimidazole-succinocarboxamide synthase
MTRRIPPGHFLQRLREAVRKILENGRLTWVSREQVLCQEFRSTNFFPARSTFFGTIDKPLRLIRIPDDSPKTICTVTSTTQTYDVLLQTDFSDLELYASGKVRDIYLVDNEHLLFIATDRISAFDYVLATGIPQKGRVLTQLSLFWFDFLKNIVPNHLATADVHKYPAELQKYSAQLRGRSMLVVKAEMVAIECVVRGYLSGSGWKEYKASGEVCGIKLPAGLRESDKLPEPIFTPATKAASGHDENISFDQMVKLAGRDLSEQLRDLSLRVYKAAADYAETRGIIIADTKFEFGRTPQGLVLADEVLTPDSSRFWPKDKYQPGGAQDSFDKQYVRDYLEAIKWNKQPPAPGLPPEVAARTSEKYVEAYTKLTGHALPA